MKRLAVYRMETLRILIEQMNLRKKMLFHVLGLLFFSSVLMSCRKDVNWNADWVLPLVNDRLTVSKFVNDSTLGENNGLYVLDLKRDLYNFSLTDIVSIPDTTIDRSVSMTFPSLQINPGFQFYNSIEEHELNLQELQLKVIELAAGTLDFELKNPVNTGVFITLELPGVTKNNQMLSRTFFIEGGTQSNPSSIAEKIDLSGFKLDLRGQAGDSWNKLQSRVIIKTDPNGQMVTVTNQHLFQIRARFHDIKLHYARGYFGSRVLEDTVDFNLDALNSVVAGQIDINNASLKLTVTNGIKVGGTGILNTVTSRRNDGTTVALAGEGIGSNFTIDVPVGSFSTLQPTEREFLFNSSTSNIEEFVENLGSKYEVGYKFQINPWGNISGGWDEVFPESKLALRVEAQMPLAIKMDQLTLRDTFAFSLDQSKDKSHIESGILHLDLENGFPFGARLEVQFLDDYNQVIETIIPSNEISSSTVGTEVLATNPLYTVSKSTVEVPLTYQVVDRLNDVKKIVFTVVLNTPASATNNANVMVQIPVDAYFAIKAKAKFQLKVKF